MRLLTYLSSLFEREESSLQDILARERNERKANPRAHSLHPYSSRTTTQDVLHPDTNIRVCAECRVLFHPRPDTPGDDFSLCLQCNREGWSKLCRKQEPETSTLVPTTPIPVSTTNADILLLRRSAK